MHGYKYQLVPTSLWLKRAKPAGKAASAQSELVLRTRDGVYCLPTVCQLLQPETKAVCSSVPADGLSPEKPALLLSAIGVPDREADTRERPLPLTAPLLANQGTTWLFRTRSHFPILKLRPSGPLRRLHDYASSWKAIRFPASSAGPHVSRMIPQQQLVL